MSDPTAYDVVVIGGGITGLTAANRLHAQGYHVLLLEAAAKLGGRARSLRDATSDAYLGDLGPTWVWPEAQPIASAALADLDLTLLPQFDAGATIVEHSATAPPLPYRVPGMHGSMRIAGGTEAIIQQLADSLPTHAILAEAPVTTITLHGELYDIATSSARCPRVQARAVVVAMPLRIAAETLACGPLLPPHIVEAMQAVPTWMAAQAKVVAVYARPFWRARGLSGRLVSRVGPLVEAHDHSGPDGSPAAIFGFLGWPHDVRQQRRASLPDQIIAQLVRCFGQEAAAPIALHVEDWAQDPRICGKRDRSEPPERPGLAQRILREPLANGRLFLAVAELSTVSPGLIEGAFDVGAVVAERVAATHN